MVRHFVQLADHRQYALALYRDSLRAVLRGPIQSGSMKLRLREMITTRWHLNRNTKSSWHVYRCLEQQRQLNISIRDRDWSAVMKILKKLQGKVLDTSDAQSTRPTQNSGNTQSILTQYERNVLDAYYKHNPRPKNGVTPSYEKQLVLPLAMHDWHQRRLTKLLETVSKEPRTQVAHAFCGKSSIYFVRSILNRRTRHSKGLSLRIRQEKRDTQRHIDCTRYIEDFHLFWALHEGSWELLLATGTLPKYHSSSLSKFVYPSTIDSWVAPLREWYIESSQKQTERAQFYRDFREKDLPKLADYWHQKAMAVHHRRLDRLERLISKGLPRVNPFVNGRTLSDTLAQHGFAN